MPPSSVTKVNRCVLPVVSVGAVSPPHLTLVGQVTVPLVCVNSRVKAKARLDGALLNVNVLFALIVLVK